ncbi:OsmC family protein [Microbacterium sp. CIAB417]|uniref:OsmC family protein n=1 Tax=Microbacterium sp. CIAB417 TaxID=2860287 RepID=UPI001FAC15E2|nr:OsmC family protein [Microbacterium sp. CIAB417]
MSAVYRTEAVNRTGADGVSAVSGGLAVAVSSPLGTNRDAEATDPEQLLALAWATCLNGTAQVIVAGARRTAVRVEVELHPAVPGPGYEFRVDGYLSIEGASDAEAHEILAAAHARCPVSKLLRDAATVHVHTEAYAIS